MRKYILSLLALSALTIFSGCGPAKTENNEPSKFTLSETIWRTDDGGNSWSVKNQASEKPRTTLMDVLSMAVNPRNDRNIYVGLMSGGILATEDGGDNWKFTTFLPEKAYGIAISPADPRVVYATGVWEGRGKIFKSADGGENWGEIYTSASSGPLVISLLVDPHDDKRIYATTSDNQVIVSSDSGNNWKNIYSANAPVVKVAIDREKNELIYLMQNDGQIKRSKDKGKSFEDITAKVTGFSIYGSNLSILEADPSRSGWLYAAGGVGLIRSKDAGNSWETLNVLHVPKDFPIRALAINPRNSDEIFYGAGQAIYKSLDGGKSWSPYQFDNDSPISLLKYNPMNPAVIYLGFSNK